jgi:aryl-alcohol dehydrogenase-like predicted oxidoreductase
MKYVNLGRTGLRVSRLCLGTMNFGPETTEPDSFAIMDRALDLGFNFFDTANVYGWKTGEGVTEQIIGRWLAQGAGRREKIVLATKVYGRMGPGQNDVKLSAYHIRRACDESLKRLKTDRIDLYQMHHVDRDTPWEEIWQAMEQLVAAGKVLYVGTSNFAAWNIVAGNAAAARRNFLGVVSEQSLYNLAARTIELEVIPACRAQGVAILPWSPLSSGLLGGALKKAKEGRRSSESNQKRIDKKRPQLERWEKHCAERGSDPADVALAWMLANPAITSPIVGPRTMAQLEASLKALDLQLSKEELAKLDEIWPGPGGEAPEAYAW